MLVTVLVGNESFSFDARTKLPHYEVRTVLVDSNGPVPVPLLLGVVVLFHKVYSIRQFSVCQVLHLRM